MMSKHVSIKFTIVIIGILLSLIAVALLAYGCSSDSELEIGYICPGKLEVGGESKIVQVGIFGDFEEHIDEIDVYTWAFSSNDGGSVSFDSETVEWGEIIEGIAPEKWVWRPVSEIMRFAEVTVTGTSPGTVIIRVAQPFDEEPIHWAARSTALEPCTISIDGPEDGNGEPPANQPPSLKHIGNQSAFVGELLTFTISGTDPDNDELTYSIEDKPTGATFNEDTGEFSWLPDSDDIGPHTVHFGVSDGTDTDPEDITITVVQKTTPVEDSVIGIPVGSSNYYMALSPDGSKLYVGDYGPVLQGEEGKVWVINTSDNKITDEIVGLGHGFPYQIAFTPDGSKAYLAVTKKAGSTLTDGANRIVVIDTSDNEVTGSINIEGAQNYGPVTVAMHPDGDYVYTTHHGLNRIDAIDTNSGTVVSSIHDVGSVPMGIAITPDEKRLWVVNSVDNTLAVINIESSDMQLIQKSIPLGLESSGGHAFITITPDGTRAYVTNQGDHIAVVNINPDSDNYLQVEYVKTSTTRLNQVAISPDGKRALVANNTDSVLIIDTDPASESYNQQIGLIPIGYSTVGVIYPDLPEALAYISSSEGVWVIKELP